MKEVFEKVYPFTTENNNLYLDSLDLKGGRVATVGSSLDQAFNAIAKGAGSVTVIDINKSTKEFLKLKKEMLLYCKNRYEFYQNVLKLNGNYADELFSFNDLTGMCFYLSSDEEYEKLRSSIGNADIEVVNGSIFDESSFDGEFSAMIFSNVMQYLNLFKGNMSFDEFIKDNFEMWNNHLTDDGKMELLYLYAYNRGYESLEGYSLYELLNALPLYQFSLKKYDDDACLLYDKEKQLIKRSH